MLIGAGVEVIATQRQEDDNYIEGGQTITRRRYIEGGQTIIPVIAK